jgi:predicted alpha/beta superfamily hydrolase
MVMAGQIEPLIIVGINHAGEDRMHELTPTPSKKHKAGGRGPHYAKFLIEELKPFIDANYRTRPERDYTGTGGSSLGGLTALYLGFAVPDVFSRLMVMSPSLWWDRRGVLQELRAAQDKVPLKIWLDAGTNEGGGTLQNVRMLKNALIRRGWAHGGDLRYVEAQGADHSEAAWAARVGGALEFLFPRA